MKSNRLVHATTLCLLFAANAYADGFGGPYVGANAGANISTATSQLDRKSAYVGAVAGYDWGSPRYLVGVNGFYDAHGEAYTGKDVGVDIRLGLPLDSWLPYAKFGLVGTSPGVRFHGGLGVAHKFAANWSVHGEWTVDSKSSGAVTYNNNNFIVGISYHFGGNNRHAAAAAQSVPAPLIAGEPVVAKALGREEARHDAGAGSRQPSEQSATQPPAGPLN